MNWFACSNYALLLSNWKFIGNLDLRRLCEFRVDRPSLIFIKVKICLLELSECEVLREFSVYGKPCTSPKFLMQHSQRGRMAPSLPSTSRNDFNSYHISFKWTDDLKVSVVMFGE